MRIAARIRTVVDALGHIGAWAGAYSSAAAVFFAQLSGLSTVPRASLVVSVFLTATGAYALDRVKLRDAWIDPADLEAQPARFAFLCAHAKRIRFLAFACVAGASLVGLLISPWAPLACIAAVGGVIAYAARPRRVTPRPKDIPWVKNLYVASGIAVFGALAALAAHSASDPTTPRPLFELLHSLLDPRIATTIAILIARVVVDAALCDLDDAASDAKFGTRTFATLLGRERLWIVSGLARVALIGLTLRAAPSPLMVRGVWAAALVLGTLAIRLRPPRSLRDAVDVRFAAEAALATAALRWFAG